MNNKNPIKKSSASFILFILICSMVITFMVYKAFETIHSVYITLLFLIIIMLSSIRAAQY